MSGRKAKSVHERVDVARRRDPSFDAILDALRAAATACRQHGCSTAHRLLNHEAKAVAERGKREHVRALVLALQVCSGEVRHVLEQAASTDRGTPA